MRIAWRDKSFRAGPAGVERVPGGVQISVGARKVTVWLRDQPHDTSWQWASPALWLAVDGGPTIDLFACVERTPPGGEKGANFSAAIAAFAWHGQVRDFAAAGWGYNPSNPLALRPSVRAVPQQGGGFLPTASWAGLFGAWLRQPVRAS